MSEAVLLVELGIDASNNDIIDQMRIMKRVRTEGPYEFIICAIRGFDDDSRELYEIPEVRAFCRRIVNLGFISYLEFSTSISPNLPETVKKGWGATEVWLCSEGRLHKPIEVTKELLEELKQAIIASNTRADAQVGPIGA